MEKTFVRQLDSLTGVFDFVTQFADQHDCDESTRYILNLVVEELFTNMVKYSPDGDREIPIAIDREKTRIIIRLVDKNVRRFDITKAKKPPIDQPLRERKPGGLGLHLIREMVDEIRYQYRDGNSEVTVVKNLGS
jgi:anti-sigma regulatory factor (Ser/Thr protein kinase)